VAVKRVRSISKNYVDHLSHIARIFLGCRENASEAARRVNEQIPGLRCSGKQLLRWKGNRQWEDALGGARDDVAFEHEFKPNVRGRQFLVWARDALERLKAEHEEAIEELEGGEKRKARIQALEARIVKLNEAIRAEEKHQAEIFDRAARRDMRAFAKNVIELLGTYLNEQGLRHLQDLQRDPAALMKGIE